MVPPPNLALLAVIVVTSVVVMLTDATSAAATDRKLLAVDVLYRHGDRTPINPYPTDPYKGPGIWPVGYGQLTARGKMMHYKLGKYLKSRYGHLLGDKYNETLIRVRSTDVDRTLMSAQSNLAGLYPPTGDQLWNPDLEWQPVPVHTVPLEDDNLLSSHAKCPRFDQLNDQLMASDEIQSINRQHRDVYEYASIHSGRNVTNLIEVDYLSDTLYIESLYNFTLPDWTKTVYPQPLRSLQDLSFKLSTWTKAMARLRAGPLIKTIFERMEGVTNAQKENGTFTDYKMLMYSAHDTTVAALLNGLDLFDPPIAPTYASCVMVELFYNEKIADSEIRILFRNESDREPYTLRMCDGNEFCTLDQFRIKTASVRPDDWKSECGLDDDNTGEDPAIWMVSIFSFIVTSIILSVLIISVIVSLCRRKQGRCADYKYSCIESSR